MSTRRSKRLTGLVQSDIRRMTLECVRAGGLNLGQGICDMPTPEAVLHRAHQAIDADHSTYSRFDGIDPLRHAIARKSARDNNLPCNPDNEVVVTIGATGAFAATVMALLDPGDEVILFEPYYGYHLNTLRVAQINTRFVTLAPPNWRVDFDALAAAITPRTRAIVINTPANPCGKVWQRDELEQVAALCQEHDLLAITDEIYEYIVYDGHTHISLATLPGMRERTVTISGYSKTFSITGWRLGYVVAPQPLAQAIGLVNDLFYVCAPTPLQHAVAHGIDTLPTSYYADMCADYQNKRDQICAALRDANLPPYDPAGAYYVLADVSRLNAPSARDAAMQLLNQAGVATVPGSAFFRGDEGESLVRFCFAKAPDILDRACEQLRAL